MRAPPPPGVMSAPPPPPLPAAAAPPPPGASAEAAVPPSSPNWRSDFSTFARAKSTEGSISASWAAAAPVAAAAAAGGGGGGGAATGGSAAVDGAGISSSIASASAQPPPKRMTTAMKRFYDEQDGLIAALEETEARLTAISAGGGAGSAAAAAATATATASAAATARWVSTLINICFTATLFIFVLKIAVAVYSSSLAITASAIESTLDVLSNSIIWCSARIAKRKNVRKWPIGKTRLEPVSIIIFAAIMGVCALQIIISSIQDIIKVSGDGEASSLKVDAVAYGSLGAVLAVKSALFALCYAYRASASIAALAQDSLNDMISDVAALIAILIVVKVPGAWWVDPAVAMGISVFLITTWVRTGREHVIGLVGHSADKTQQAQLTYLAMNHDSRIQGVDTVRAYFVGLKLVVELDIVLPPDMPLRTAHDIGEALQLDIERLDYVERAYVHMDYVRRRARSGGGESCQSITHALCSAAQLAAFPPPPPPSRRRRRKPRTVRTTSTC